MKKYIVFLLALFFAIGCSTSKKVAKKHEVIDKSVESAEISYVDRIIDTTVVDKNKITITEVEFYEPIIINNNTSTIDDVDAVESIHIDNIGKIGSSSSIKSIKQIIIESELEEKGKSEEHESSEVDKKDIVLSEVETYNEIKPIPDRYRWRYIFFTILVLIAVFLYFKRSSVAGWIKKVINKIGVS